MRRVTTEAAVAEKRRAVAGLQRVGLVPAVKRWWWLLLLAAAVAGLGGHFVSSRTEPTYEAEARLLVGPIATDLDILRAAGQLTGTYADLATSGPLLRATAVELGLPSDVDLKEAVSVTANDLTRLLSVRVRHSDAAVAADVANVVARKLANLSAGPVPRGSRPDAIPGRLLRIVEPATPPIDPIWPQPLLIAPLAALTGLVGALVLLLLVDRLRTTIRDEEELAELTDVPLLGSLELPRRQPIVFMTGRQSWLATAYRLLAAQLSFADGGRRVRSIVVVGVDPEDGSGRLAVNLALALRESARRVVVVDVNLGDGEASSLLGVERGIGLGDEDGTVPTLDDGELARLLVETPFGVSVLPKWTTEHDSFDEARVQEVLERLQAEADFVVISASPVARSSAALAWARAAGATALVVHRNRTGRDDLARAVQSLEIVAANLVGTILVTTTGLPAPGGRRRVQSSRLEAERWDLARASHE